jgi:hypothetical protein
MASKPATSLTFHSRCPTRLFIAVLVSSKVWMPEWVPPTL